MGNREVRQTRVRKLLSILLSAAMILQVPATVAANEPEYIAVVELHQRGTRPDYTRKITDRFREELSRYRHLKILSREESKAILDYKKSAVLEAGQVSPIHGMVADAKKAYFALQLAKAKRLTDEAIENCLQTSQLTRDYRSLQEAYTVQGIVLLAQHRKRDATESFRKLVRYDPYVELDEKYFAPSVIKRIERAKRELKEQPSGHIEVRSQPSAADVYINGIYKGAAPLKLGNYPVGEHVVTVKAANYTSKSETVSVTAGQTEQVKLKLGWKGKNNRYPKDMVGFHRDQFDDLEELIGTASAAAQSMRVRKLILVDLRREKGNDIVRAHIIDESLSTFHRPVEATTKRVQRQSAQVSATLATQVLAEMDQTIMDDPAGLAAAPYYGDVVLIGKSRSLLKNPWFWVGMGALAGGATAGAMVATGTNTTGAINVIFR